MKWMILMVHVVIFSISFYTDSTGQVDELRLKGFFLEAAMRFISWPESELVNHIRPEATFSIGYFKSENMTPYVKQSFSRKMVKDREVRFLEIQNLTDIDSCDVLLIPAYKKDELKKIIEKVNQRPILTVCDHPDLCRNGVILCITIENRKIKCYINSIQAQNSKLSISHHLLQKADVLNTDEVNK